MQPMITTRISLIRHSLITLGILMFANITFAGDAVIRPQKTETANSQASYNENFFARIASMIEESSRDSSIAILYRSETFSQMDSDTFGGVRNMLLRVPPSEIYAKASEWYKLNREEVDALRVLMGINISIAIHELGYPKETIDSLNNLVVHSKGIGEVELGMSIHEASDKLGIDVWSSPYQYGSQNCYSYALAYSKDDWVIRFIVEDEKIAKIDVFGNTIPTDNDIKIGDTASRVMDLYPGRYKLVGAHDPSMGIIIVPFTDNTGYEFTVDQNEYEEDSYIGKHTPDDKIINFSVGLMGAGTVEGCL